MARVEETLAVQPPRLPGARPRPAVARGKLAGSSATRARPTA